MMELSFKYLPLIKEVIDEPHSIVILSAFGTPSLMIVLAFVAFSYKNQAFAKPLNTIIFSSLGIVLLLGTALMLALWVAGVSPAKMYLIWVLLVIAVFIFTTVNIQAIMKYLDDEMPKLKKNK